MLTILSLKRGLYWMGSFAKLHYGNKVSTPFKGIPKAQWMSTPSFFDQIGFNKEIRQGTKRWAFEGSDREENVYDQLTQSHNLAVHKALVHPCHRLHIQYTRHGAESGCLLTGHREVKDVVGVPAHDCISFRGGNNLEIRQRLLLFDGPLPSYGFEPLGWISL